MQNGQEWMGRGFAVLTYFKGVCDLEGPGGNSFTQPRAGTSLWGLRATLTGRGKREVLGTCVSLPGRRQERSCVPLGPS